MSEATATVNVAAVDRVMLAALSEAVRPSGEIVVMLTDPENPFRGATVIVEVALDPAGADIVEGVEAIEKSGPATVTDTKVG